MPPKPKLNVQSFPRPPLIERTDRHLQVKYQGQIIADTKEAYWVLETYHAPTYYFPPSSLSTKTFPLSKSHKSTFCEWKGTATYHNITLPPLSTSPTTSLPPASSQSTSSQPCSIVVKDRIWSYSSPSPRFAALKDYLSFYAGDRWECFVDGEKVVPQPGDFYGGWTTSELEGIIKGDAATRWL